MKKYTLLFIITMGWGVCAEPTFEVITERPGAIYKIGEKVTFLINVFEKGQPLPGYRFKYQITIPGETIAREGELSSTGSPLKLEAFSSQPGFIQLQLFISGAKRMSGGAGAAIEPEKILPARKVSSDFVEYWNTQKKMLYDATLDVSAVPIKSNTTGIKCFEITINIPDLRATGILAVPEKKRKYPVVATFNGASQIGADQSYAERWARNYRSIIFNMNIHDCTIRPDNDEKRAIRNEVKNYMYASADSKEKYPMGDVFRRVILVMRYLKTLPEWNNQDLIVRGGSLGGAQALVAAAMTPEVTLAISLATAMCDHYGHEAGRQSGWPKLISKIPNAEETAGYFDIANFASLVRCQTLMAVGFIDTVAPPDSSYAAYNNLLTKEKEIIHQVFSTHGPSLKKGEKSVMEQGGNLVWEIGRKAEINSKLE